MPFTETSGGTTVKITPTTATTTSTKTGVTTTYKSPTTTTTTTTSKPATTTTTAPSTQLYYTRVSGRWVSSTTVPTSGKVYLKTAPGSYTTYVPPVSAPVVAPVKTIVTPATSPQLASQLAKQGATTTTVKPTTTTAPKPTTTTTVKPTTTPTTVKIGSTTLTKSPTGTITPVSSLVTPPKTTVAPVAPTTAPKPVTTTTVKPATAPVTIGSTTLIKSPTGTITPVSSLVTPPKTTVAPAPTSTGGYVPISAKPTTPVYVPPPAPVYVPPPSPTYSPSSAPVTIGGTTLVKTPSGTITPISSLVTPPKTTVSPVTTSPVTTAPKPYVPGPSAPSSVDFGIVKPTAPSPIPSPSSSTGGYVPITIKEQTSTPAVTMPSVSKPSSILPSQPVTVGGTTVLKTSTGEITPVSTFVQKPVTSTGGRVPIGVKEPAYGTAFQPTPFVPTPFKPTTVSPVTPGGFFSDKFSVLKTPVYAKKNIFPSVGGTEVTVSKSNVDSFMETEQGQFASGTLYTMPRFVLDSSGRAIISGTITFDGGNAAMVNKWINQYNVYSNPAAGPGSSSYWNTSDEGTVPSILPAYNYPKREATTLLNPFQKMIMKKSGETISSLTSTTIKPGQDTLAAENRGKFNSYIKTMEQIKTSQPEGSSINKLMNNLISKAGTERDKITSEPKAITGKNAVVKELFDKRYSNYEDVKTALGKDNTTYVGYIDDLKAEKDKTRSTSFDPNYMYDVPNYDRRLNPETKQYEYFINGTTRIAGSDTKAINNWLKSSDTYYNGYINLYENAILTNSRLSKDFESEQNNIIQQKNSAVSDWHPDISLVRSTSGTYEWKLPSGYSYEGATQYGFYRRAAERGGTGSIIASMFSPENVLGIPLIVNKLTGNEQGARDAVIRSYQGWDEINKALGVRPSVGLTGMKFTPVSSSQLGPEWKQDVGKAGTIFAQRWFESPATQIGIAAVGGSILGKAGEVAKAAGYGRAFTAGGAVVGAPMMYGAYRGLESSYRSGDLGQFAGQASMFGISTGVMVGTAARGASQMRTAIGSKTATGIPRMILDRSPRVKTMDVLRQKIASPLSQDTAMGQKTMILPREDTLTTTKLNQVMKYLETPEGRRTNVRFGSQKGTILMKAAEQSDFISPDLATGAVGPVKPVSSYTSVQKVSFNKTGRISLSSRVPENVMSSFKEFTTRQSITPFTEKTTGRVPSGFKELPMDSRFKISKSPQIRTFSEVSTQGQVSLLKGGGPSVFSDIKGAIQQRGDFLPKKPIGESARLQSKTITTFKDSSISPLKTIRTKLLMKGPIRNFLTMRQGGAKVADIPLVKEARLTRASTEPLGPRLIKTVDYESAVARYAGKKTGTRFTSLESEIRATQPHVSKSGAFEFGAGEEGRFTAVKTAREKVEIRGTTKEPEVVLRRRAELTVNQEIPGVERPQVDVILRKGAKPTITREAVDVSDIPYQKTIKYIEKRGPSSRGKIFEQTGKKVNKYQFDVTAKEMPGSYIEPSTLDVIKGDLAVKGLKMEKGATRLGSKLKQRFGKSAVPYEDTVEGSKILKDYQAGKITYDEYNTKILSYEKNPLMKNTQKLYKERMKLFEASSKIDEVSKKHTLPGQKKVTDDFKAFTKTAEGEKVVTDYALGKAKMAEVDRAYLKFIDRTTIDQRVDLLLKEKATIKTGFKEERFKPSGLYESKETGSGWQYEKQPTLKQLTEMERGIQDSRYWEGIKPAAEKISISLPATRTGFLGSIVPIGGITGLTQGLTRTQISPQFKPSNVVMKPITVPSIRTDVIQRPATGNKIVQFPSVIQNQFQPQIPVSVIGQKPRQIPRETPIQIPRQIPVQINTPIQIPRETPIERQTPIQTPVQIPGQRPVRIPRFTPIQSPVQTPVQYPVEIPRQGQIRVPVQRPIQKQPPFIPPIEVPPVPPAPKPGGFTTQTPTIPFLPGIFSPYGNPGGVIPADEGTMYGYRKKKYRLNLVTPGSMMTPTYRKPPTTLGKKKPRMFQPQSNRFSIRKGW